MGERIEVSTSRGPKEDVTPFRRQDVTYKLVVKALAKEAGVAWQGGVTKALWQGPPFDLWLANTKNSTAIDSVS
jgi:hypothetical protein